MLKKFYQYVRRSFGAMRQIRPQHKLKTNAKTNPTIHNPVRSFGAVLQIRPHHNIKTCPKTNTPNHNMHIHMELCSRKIAQ